MMTEEDTSHRVCVHRVTMFGGPFWRCKKENYHGLVAPPCTPTCHLYEPKPLNWFERQVAWAKRLLHL